MLVKYSEEKNVILMEAIKTAYSTAYERLLLLIKAGKIGRVISVDATCTSLRNKDLKGEWNNIFEWGPTALLPIFQILGTDNQSTKIVTHFRKDDQDSFTKIDFMFNSAVASIKIGDGFKSEGDLIISGSEGYIYVPAPWWKTDYFEVRFENPTDNKRYFYQLDGEGIRYEIVAFAKAVEKKEGYYYISKDVSEAIVSIIDDYDEKKYIRIS